MSEPPPDPFAPVELNGQIWTGKNLAIDDGGEGIYHKTVNYGRGDVEEYYYTHGAAERVVASIDGWHIATYNDWSGIKSKIGQKALCADYGWSSSLVGTNTSNFTALPAGKWDGSTGLEAYFWTEYDSIFFMIDIMGMRQVVGNVPMSVRLVKD